MGVSALPAFSEAMFGFALRLGRASQTLQAGFGMLLARFGSSWGSEQKALGGMKAFDVSPNGTYSDGGAPTPYYSQPLSAMGPGPITEDVAVGQRGHLLGGPKHGVFLNAPGL